MESDQLDIEDDEIDEFAPNEVKDIKSLQQLNYSPSKSQDTTTVPGGIAGITT